MVILSKVFYGNGKSASPRPKSGVLGLVSELDFKCKLENENLKFAISNLQFDNNVALVVFGFGSLLVVLVVFGFGI